MHDIWNPWHGCAKCSEGCQHCYMYFLDRVRERNGAGTVFVKDGKRCHIPKKQIQSEMAYKSGMF